MKPPLEMPAALYSQHEFELDVVEYRSPEGGGRIGGVQAGEPLWMAVYTLDGGLLSGESDQARAFKSQLRGASRRILGRDIGRPYPKAHLGGFAGMTRPDASPFDGTALGWSENITADGDSEVTLEGLPPELLQLGLCDYIGFSWVATETPVAGLTWHTCVRVGLGATSDADGNTIADADGNITVTCEPVIPRVVPPGATAYLNGPACVMTQITEQSKLQPINFRLAIGGGQFAFMQDLRG